MENVQEKIHQKGFDITASSRRGYEGPLDYNSIKVGTKTLDDAVLNLGALQKIQRNLANKDLIYRALKERNLPLLREISDYFYNSNGIYARICDYFAFMYRYDWYVVPSISDESVKTEKVLKEFTGLLDFLDNSHIQKVCGEIALSVIKNGAYYGYLIPSKNSVILQELPVNYCRSNWKLGGEIPVVEFNMRFFDEHFRDINYRMKVLKMFPKDIQKGYVLYKTGKLPCEHLGPYDDIHPNHVSAKFGGSWYTLEPGAVIKFNLANGDQPMFVNAIPSIIDLDAAQDLDRRKQMQQLLKVVIQKLPLDKNGDLIFDVDEARDIHNNAVEMLQHAIGVDVLTTFADIAVEDMADNNTATSADDLEKMERTVYNNLGISRNIFNSENTLSLEKSILDDESTMRSLLLQFHIFYDRIVQSFSNNRKKYNFRLFMLETTQYNYKELSKMYKEQVQIGYSKMLPQIALGHSQSSIIHTAHFENEILKLSEIMIPPLMSSTMNADAIMGKEKQSGAASSQNSNEGAGRPEKPDSEKSEKTVQNKEAL